LVFGALFLYGAIGMSEYNAADPRHVKGRKDQEKRELLKNEDAFKYVMGDVRGRNFVWNLLGYTGMYTDSFTGNSHTFYNEGRRSIGLKLMKALEEACPKEFIAMWQEHLTNEEKDKKEDEAIRTNGNGEEF
jgi:hypothetical protein